VSQGTCTEIGVEDDNGQGHARHGHVTFAQFQQQLARLCQELNLFSELTAAERDIVASPRAEQRGVEQLLGALSGQLLGALPSRLSRETAAVP
jgi:hypothetical protein